MDDRHDDDNDDCFSKTSSTGAPTRNTKRAAALQERQTLARRETRIIWILRLVVALTFVGAALTASIIVYNYVSNVEQESFQTDFFFHAEKVRDSVNQAVTRKLSAVDALSVAITSHSISSKSEFPFVTLPNFEYHGSLARIVGDSVLAFYMPLVTDATKAAWVDFSLRNAEALFASGVNERHEKDIQDAKFGYTPREVELPDFLTEGRVIVPAIWHPYIPPSELTEPYLPIWLSTPVLPPEAQLANLDMTSFLPAQGSLDVVLKTGKASLDVILTLPEADVEDQEGEGATETFRTIIQFGQYRHTSSDYQLDPLTSLSYPVFDKLNQDKKVAGAIFTTMYWRFFFTDILPENIEGLVCVVENSLGQQATYQVNGREASFVGMGDLHDPEYEDTKLIIDLEKYLNEKSSPETRTFTAVDLDSDFIAYTLRVYPSDTFRDIYITDDATVEAAVIGSVFLFAALIFIAYDCCVERRQRIVLDRAVNSIALVSTLFPDNVRERLINGNTKDEGDRPQSVLAPKNMGAFKVSGQKADPLPMAELFPNTTVLFADLAGFTQWSSSRDPAQVFRLLEEIFKHMDLLAVRRGVFKVETIGDCYMAATGLPKPQDDHAIRMAKFANDCLHKISQVLQELSLTMGSDTDLLDLRMGMHSGQVTAGVLRGDKSRFQLFGDTVNTASRMESTGIPGRIQLSQPSVDVLVTGGKASWVVPRESKVEAKGKGQMQTYWLQMSSKTSSVVSVVVSEKSSQKQHEDEGGTAPAPE